MATDAVKDIVGMHARAVVRELLRDVEPNEVLAEIVRQWRSRALAEFSTLDWELRESLLSAIGTKA